MSFQTIQINPVILKWARESARFDLYDIPESTISYEKLIKIESGEAMPSFTQLQKLAKKYERPLGILLGDKIPENDYPIIPFFRKEKKTDYDSALTLFIRDIQDKQDWARNYLISEGYEPISFAGSIRLEDKVQNTAQKIIENISMPSYSSYKNNKEYLNAIKECLEEHNIFISITGSNLSNKSIGIEQAQGFAITDEYAPFIFVNTKNTTNAKVFTLIHEVVHIFLDESGISEDTIKYRKPECREDIIENYCNSVAANILMPKEIIISKFNEIEGAIEEKIKYLSQVFFVSELAICVRLWKLQLLNFQEYNYTYRNINKKIQKYLEEKEKKQKSKKSGGDYYNNMRSKNGKLFSSLVYSAYKSGDILSRDLGNILKIKTNNINKYFSTI